MDALLIVRAPVALLILAGVLAASCSTAPQADTSPRPNIIVLVADDQRADMIGLDHPILQTPHLDRLVREGVRFPNAFVTTSICAVSRASLLSGQYARRHGIHDFATRFSEAALAETYPALMRAGGYFTGFIGKFGVGDRMPDDLFDVWHGFGGQGSYFAQDAGGNPIHLTRLMGQQAAGFLAEAAQQDKPFLLSVSFKAPHVEGLNDFTPDPAFDTLYAGAAIPPPAVDDYDGLEPYALFGGNAGEEGRARWQVRFSSDSLYQENTRRYYRLISGIDEAVGAILAALESRGQADNTVILYTSDNGFYLGEHGLAGKWYGHEESIRVPMILYDPRLPRAQRGEVREEVALNIDVAPTVLSLAGLPAPERMQGQNLGRLLQGDDAGWRTEFFYEHLFDYDGRIPRSEGVVGRRYKYLRYIDQEPPGEVLYDLQSDPHEAGSRAGDPALRDTLETMRARWAAYRQALN
jgi:arylsulfatase A-like enzyme